jgi:hypothetical protein
MTTPAEGQTPDTPAAATPAEGQPAAAPAAEGRVPHHVVGELRGKLAAAETARAAAEARVAELERVTARLGVRADLGIGDDDDADRVWSSFERAHKDVAPDKRPKVAEWARSEAAAAALPTSLREHYRLGAPAAPAAGQVGQTPAQRAPLPVANRGAAPAPAGRAGADPFEGATREQAREALKGLRLR